MDKERIKNVIRALKEAKEASDNGYGIRPSWFDQQIKSLEGVREDTPDGTTLTASLELDTGSFTEDVARAKAQLKELEKQADRTAEKLEEIESYDWGSVDD